jgi:cation transport ATPase
MEEEPLSTAVSAKTKPFYAAPVDAPLASTTRGESDVEESLSSVCKDGSLLTTAAAHKCEPVRASEALTEEPITVETASKDVVASEPHEEENEEETIKKDAADKVVALIVHFALAFFVVLVIVASFLAIKLVSHFGFLAFTIVFFLLMAVCGIAWFVDHVMKEDAKWKPVRQQIRHWKAVATAVVLEEVRLFQLDWNEHLLLTDGKADYDLYDDDVDAIPAVISKATRNKDKPKQKRGRSVLFKMVKPFLHVGERRRRRRKEREAAVESAAATTESYVPPIV